MTYSHYPEVEEYCVEHASQEQIITPEFINCANMAVELAHEYGWDHVIHLLEMEQAGLFM